MNIRSVPHNFDKLRYYLDELDHKFSIIALSETWLNEYTKTTYNIIGYKHESVFRNNRMGGGVSLFITNTINYKVREDLTIDLVDVNILFIEIPKSEFKTNHNILIAVCYRAPHVRGIEFIEKLDALLDKLDKEKTYSYFIGDMNINTLNLSPASSCIASDYHNLFLSYSFQSLIDKPTREHGNSSTLIDHIYTNTPQSLNVCVSCILKASLADHYSIVCITNYTILMLIKRVQLVRGILVKKICQN